MKIRFIIKSKVINKGKIFCFVDCFETAPNIMGKITVIHIHI